MPSAMSLAPSPSSTSTLPPPSTFDILPPLHHILSRLLLPPPQGSSGAIVSTSPGLDLSMANSDYLAPKSLGTATSEIKNKIQKARMAVQGLPDVDRTIEEQQAEIKDLESEAERLNGVMRSITEAARTACEEERPQP